MVSLDRFQYAPRESLQPGAEGGAPERHSLAHALGPLLILYLLYTLVRWAVVDRAEKLGDRNANLVIRFEHWLGIDIERPLQGWLLEHSKLVWFFNHYYVFAFFPILVVSAIWGYRAAPETFHTARRIFAVSLALALLIFALVPLAPPRLLPPSAGFVDTLMLYGPHYYGDASGASLFNAYGSIPSMVNEYAAMPSMHVGWSIIAGWLLYVASGRRRWVAMLATIHVLLMETVVISTGNHYLIDGVAGALVVLVAWGVVRWWERRSSVPAPASC